MKNELRFSWRDLGKLLIRFPKMNEVCIRYDPYVNIRILRSLWSNLDFRRTAHHLYVNGKEVFLGIIRAIMQIVDYYFNL